MLSEKIDIPSILNWFSVIRSAGPFGVAILLLLVILSIVTWVIILERWITYVRLYKKTQDFLKFFWESKSLAELYTKTKSMDYSPAREMFRSGYNEMIRVLQAREKKGLHQAQNVSLNTILRSLGKTRTLEENKLHKYLNFLAISASACPFIGLFGTVVGIIRAFHDIGLSGSTSLAAVAPGISEALIATALGLLAAIPAVIFYNIFSARNRSHLITLDSFSSDFVNILERHFNVNKSSIEESNHQTLHEGV